MVRVETTYVARDGRLAIIYEVSGFGLEIGNNYTTDQFFRFLVNQCPPAAEILYEYDIDTADTIVFNYSGTYGTHTDTFVACDVFDYLHGRI